MSNKNYKAVAYELVTHHPTIKEGEYPCDVLPAYDERETRYRIEDVNTGEVLDDAQGHGYKTARKAYVGYSYKTGSKKKNKIILPDLVQLRSGLINILIFHMTC